jgi:hypothetical protein
MDDLLIVCAGMGIQAQQDESLDSFLGRLLHQAETTRRATGVSPFKMLEYYRNKIEDGWGWGGTFEEFVEHYARK